MKQAQCGEGTVITLGHPANKCLAVKMANGSWRYVETGKVVEEEAFRGMWDFYTPTHSAPVVDGEVVERLPALEAPRVALGDESGVMVVDSDGVILDEDERSF